MNREHLHCLRKTPLFHQISFTNPSSKITLLRISVWQQQRFQPCLGPSWAHGPWVPLRLQIHEAGPAPLPLLLPHGSLQSLVPSCWRALPCVTLLLETQFTLLWPECLPFSLPVISAPVITSILDLPAQSPQVRTLSTSFNAHITITILPESRWLSNSLISSYTGLLSPQHWVGFDHHYFISAGSMLLLLSRFSRVRLCATPWTAAHQASPSLGFYRKEHWSGSPFPSPMHESGKWKKLLSRVWLLATPWTGLQPTRLLHPWDSPGNTTGVGCHWSIVPNKYLWDGWMGE